MKYNLEKSVLDYLKSTSKCDTALNGLCAMRALDLTNLHTMSIAVCASLFIISR